MKDSVLTKGTFALRSGTRDKKTAPVRLVFNLVLPLLILTGLDGQAQQQRFIGTWQGSLKLGVELRIVFNITDDGNGALVTTGKSPDQSDEEFPVGSTAVSGDNIILDMKNIGASFTGKLENDSTMMGHSPYLVLADHLTRQGVAVLRVDDQGTGLTKSAMTTDTAALNQKITAVWNDWKRRQTEKTLKSLLVVGNAIVGQDIYKMYSSLYTNTWMHFFISYDPAIDLARVKCPVLAINGTKDTQVDAEKNLRLIGSILTASKNKKVQIVALPALNHLLQTAVTGDVSEYSKIEETIAPIALETMSNWINSTTNK
jgi:hypothetical protein